MDEVHQRKNNVQWNQFGLTFDSTKSNGNSASNFKEETKELFEHEQEVFYFSHLNLAEDNPWHGPYNFNTNYYNCMGYVYGIVVQRHYQSIKSIIDN